MDPNAQGSFIPKASLQAQARGNGLGFFLLISLIVFVMSLVSAGAAFVYKASLNSQITKKGESLKRDEGAFDPGAIQDLERMDSRLQQAEILLKKHVSPSTLFSVLSTLTLEKVQLQGMNFSIKTDGAGTLMLSGVGDSFSTVALQSDEFGKSKILRGVIFSGISAGEKGKVSFTVNAEVEPSVLLYSRNLTQPATQNNL